MAEIYSPDPRFYDDQIDDLNKEIEQFNSASYSSSRRGYVVNGKKYTQAQIDAQVRRLRSSVSKLQADKRKFGPYGPAFGSSAKSNRAGEKFLELYNAAQKIKVKDFDTAVQSFEAWEALNDFVAKNKNIKVAVTRDASIPTDSGYRTRGKIKVVVDPTRDSTFSNVLVRGPQTARQNAVRFSEQGVVETRTTTRGDNPNTATTSTRKVVTNQQELDRRLALLDSLGVTSPSEVDRPAPAPESPVVGRDAGATTPAGGSADAMERAALRQAEQTPTQGPLQGPFIGGAGEAGLQAAAQTLGAGGAGTGAGGTGVGGTGGGGGTGGSRRTGRPRLPKNWEARFREMFPAQSWLLDLDRNKYPDLYKLIQRGVTNRMWETPESQARFAAELQNTDFFVELRNTDKVREIKSLVGDLGFDTVPFNQFLATASNFGWEGDTLRAEVFKEAFRKDDAGNYVNPTAVTRAKSSTPWLRASQIGKQFFTTISDNFLEQRLTGVLTDEDLVRQQRELAKTKYGHLSNLIDQGFTLEELSNSFREQAARVLERDVNDIDMSQADFEAAYNFGEQGQKRMMTAGEWEILLRTDQKYGWDKTENAKQEARQLASSIVQAFGRVI